MVGEIAESLGRKVDSGAASCRSKRRAPVSLQLDGRPPGPPEAAGKGRVPFPAFLFSFQNDNVQNVGRNEFSLK